MNRVAAVGFFGASVRGPAHAIARMPNEDAWSGTRGAYGTLLVVSDGVGSRAHARHGARMACVAVRDTVRTWSSTPGTRERPMFADVERNWETRVAPLPPSTCAATCLFAWTDPRGTITVAGLGDGLAVVVSGARARFVVGPREGGFANETVALGSRHLISAWRSETFDARFVSSIVLATDGVADDLQTERIAEFAAWLVHEFGEMPGPVRWRALSRQLRDWPTPGHRDDKTVAVLHLGARA